MNSFEYVAKEPITQGDAEARSDTRSIFNTALSEARHARKNGQNPEPLWQDVAEKAEHILLRERKNIKIFCHYIEARFWTTPARDAGKTVTDALNGLAILIGDGWDGMPSEEEDEIEEKSYRAEQTEAADGLGQVIEQMPLWSCQSSFFSLYDWAMCKKLPHLEDRETLSKIPMSLYVDSSGRPYTEDRVTLETLFPPEKDASEHDKNYDLYVATALAKMSPDTLKNAAQTSEEASEAFKNFKAVVKERFTFEAPSLKNLEAAIKAWKSKADFFLNISGLAREAGETEKSAVKNDEYEENSVESNNQDKNITIVRDAFKLQNRQDAFNLIKEVSSFLRKTEPHSPVPFLLDKALKWGAMPFEKLLSELIRDENHHKEICEYIGLNRQELSEES